MILLVSERIKFYNSVSTYKKVLCVCVYIHMFIYLYVISNIWKLKAGFFSVFLAKYVSHLSF